MLRRVAEEGILLRRQLDEWRQMASGWSRKSDCSSPNGKPPVMDTPMQLALVLFHTLCIITSILYAREHYALLGLDVPILSDATKDAHAQKVLDLVSVALQKTNVAAVLFCRPIQAAALRLRDAASKQQSLDLLAEIGKRGFAVS